MKQARQRETLFTSEEEKRAQIDCYREQDESLRKQEKRSQSWLSDILEKRQELSRRIQELQNLELEL